MSRHVGDDPPRRGISLPPVVLLPPVMRYGEDLPLVDTKPPQQHFPTSLPPSQDKSLLQLGTSQPGAAAEPLPSWVSPAWQHGDTT